MPRSPLSRWKEGQPRMSLVEMSRKPKIPVSTLFDTLKEVEKFFHFTIVLKEREAHAPFKETVPFEIGHQILVDTREEDEHHTISTGNGARK